MILKWCFYTWQKRRETFIFSISPAVLMSKQFINEWKCLQRREEEKLDEMHWLQDLVFQPFKKKFIILNNKSEEQL